MKLFPKTLILACATFASVLPLIAENLYDVVDDAEKAIIQKYPNESSIAHRLAKKELEDIVFSDKTEEEKIAAIRAKYPAASVPTLPIQTESAQPNSLTQLIYRPPLQWMIHSIEIAYDVDSSTNILLSTESLYREEDGKSRDDTKGGSTNRSINAGAKTQAELDVRGSIGTPEKGAWNPLNWFQAKAGFDWVTSGYAGIDYTNTKNTQWNERAQRALSNLYEEKVSILQNTNVKNCHLTFSVSFKNNTNSDLIYNPQDVRIPVYAGNEHLTDAVPDTSLRSARIYSNASADQLFRAELNTTSALKLIAYMRSNAPQIRLDRGQIQITSENGKVRNAVQETLQVQTVPFRCRDLELRIRKSYQGKTTTIADAMRAINAVFEKATFEFNQNGECISLLGLPLAKNGSNSWNVNQLPVVGVNGSFTSMVIPATQLNRPLSENGLSIDVLDVLDGDTWDSVSSQLQSYMIQPLRAAAESGNATAQNRLGLCYNEGKGVTKNIEEAARWYRMAAEHGYIAAQWNLGFLFFENNNYMEAIPWLRKAAEQGHRYAQYYLGLCYDGGYGVSQNQNEAVKWYRKAAEQRVIFAQMALGDCYEEGKGVPQDYNEAATWYHMAAEQGNPIAQTRLGIYYCQGQGVREDKVEAVRWFYKAADQEDSGAQYWLGICYRFGLGVNMDINEAVKWYRKAANQGAEEAKQALRELGYDRDNGAVISQNASIADDLDTIKKRMNERKYIIDALKANGVIGEANTGFIHPLKAVNLDGIALIAEENKDRRAIYSSSAQKERSTIERVGELRAKQIRSMAKKGEYIQDEDGKWIKAP